MKRSDRTVTNPPNWLVLRDQFLAALSESRYGWIDLWRLLLDDPWCQAELALWSTLQTRGFSDRTISHEDIKHDAVLILAQKLRRRADLGLDASRAQEHFGPWLGSIIRNACRDAARRLRHQSSRECRLAVEPPSQDRSAEREARVDLSLAIEQLSDPFRTVLLLVSKGYSIRDVAEQTRMSYWRTYRVYREGVSRLRGGPDDRSQRSLRSGRAKLRLTTT